jgi:hypothetical protein
MIFFCISACVPFNTYTWWWTNNAGEQCHYWHSSDWKKLLCALVQSSERSVYWSGLNSAGVMIDLNTRKRTPISHGMKGGKCIARLTYRGGRAEERINRGHHWIITVDQLATMHILHLQHSNSVSIRHRWHESNPQQLMTEHHVIFMLCLVKELFILNWTGQKPDELFVTNLSTRRRTIYHGMKGGKLVHEL